MEFSLWFISLLFILTIAFEHWIRGIRTDCSWLRVGAWRDNPFQRLVVEPKCVTFFHIATSMQKLLWLFVVFVVGEILYPWLNLFVFARSISFFFLWIFKHPFPVWMLHPGYMPQIKSARFRDDEMRSKSCRLGSFCSNLRIPGVCGKNRMCFLFIYGASSM